MKRLLFRLFTMLFIFTITVSIQAYEWNSSNNELEVSSNEDLNWNLEDVSIKLLIYELNIDRKEVLLEINSIFKISIKARKIEMAFFATVEDPWCPFDWIDDGEPIDFGIGYYVQPQARVCIQFWPFWEPYYEYRFVTIPDV